MAARKNPYAYPRKVYDSICERISQGEPLRKICKDKGYPSVEAVCMKVVREPDFSEQYMHARMSQAVLMAEDIFQYSDDESRDVTGELGMPNNVAYQRDRLKVDTRKWYLSKVLPKVYGDKKIISGDPDNPILILADRLSNARKRTGRPAPKLIEAKDLELDSPAEDDDSSQD